MATTYTVIGHSLGGGVALQFAYQFPERTSRLALISSGGLGSEVTVMLRAATWPGANTAVAGLAGHYPHETAAEGLLPRLHAFLSETSSFRYDEERWRQGVTT